MEKVGATRTHETRHTEVGANFSRRCVNLPRKPHLRQKKYFPQGIKPEKRDRTICFSSQFSGSARQTEEIQTFPQTYTRNNSIKTDRNRKVYALVHTFVSPLTSLQTSVKTKTRTFTRNFRLRSSLCPARALALSLNSEQTRKIQGELEPKLRPRE